MILLTLFALSLLLSIPYVIGRRTDFHNAVIYAAGITALATILPVLGVRLLVIVAAGVTFVFLLFLMLARKMIRMRNLPLLIAAVSATTLILVSIEAYFATIVIVYTIVILRAVLGRFVVRDDGDLPTMMSA